MISLTAPGGAVCRASAGSDREVRVDGRACEQLFRELPVGWAVHDGVEVLAVNPAAAQLVGYPSPAELVGRSVLELVHPESQGLALSRMTSVLSSGGPVRVEAEQMVCRDGTFVWLETVAAPVEWEGAAAVQVLLWDVTQRVRTEERLSHAASHDALTTLPTRSRMEEHWRELQALNGARGPLPAVLFCDLDGFKQVNDRHGHGVGDEVLRAVGARLRSVVRADELVGRLGGDEFVLLIAHGTQETAEHLAERVRTAVCAPIRVGDVLLCTGVSIGYARAGGPLDTLSDVLHRADAEMYAAKRTSRDVVVPEPAEHADLG